MRAGVVAPSAEEPAFPSCVPARADGFPAAEAQGSSLPGPGHPNRNLARPTPLRSRSTRPTALGTGVGVASPRCLRTMLSAQDLNEFI